MAEKLEAEFNVEHVMPQAFGKFEQNFTLVHIVCTACNNFFSRELELWLTRDSLEGFDRYRYDLKPPSEFKSQGKRSTTRLQLTEGPYAGAWGFAVPGQETLGIRPFPQIGVASSPGGPFEWFLVDDLPTTDDLKAKGYSGNIYLRSCECSTEEATVRLGEKGIDVTFTDTQPPPSGGTWIEQVFRPTLDHRRGVAKIAFNYLAYQYGAAIALEPRFDAVRDLVMASKEPSHKYYDVDERPIVAGDKQDGKRYFGHAIVVRQRGDHVEGIVSLYNRFRHGFLLAKEPGSMLEPRGHFFDIGNRIIHALLPS